MVLQEDMQLKKAIQSTRSTINDEYYHSLNVRVLDYSGLRIGFFSKMEQGVTHLMIRKDGEVL
jgi:hypothetical protein